MNVLIHYTTKINVFYSFSKTGSYTFLDSKRIEEVSKFYHKFHRFQERLFFIVSYYDRNIGFPCYTVSDIIFDEQTGLFNYFSVSEEIKEIVLDDLSLNTSNTYYKETYYRVLKLDGSEKEFINNKKEVFLNKIKMKFFTWDELILSKEILFNEINEKIFDKENVLRVASTYTPKSKYTDKQKKLKYRDALKSIGFISEKGIKTSNTTLHGDIGEFLMHIMLSQFLSKESNEKYIYPKLVFKTSPHMPVYGNDGTIYLKDRKEIYYLEAKFYTDLKSAINKAVESLTTHNEISQEELSHKIELFRNVKTDELFEVIEIDSEVKENLVLFLICDDLREYDDIFKVVNENDKLKDLKKNFNVVLFVLPILSKREFLDFFSEKSNGVWSELNA